MKTVKFLYLVAFAAFLLMMISCGDNGARTAPIENAGKAVYSFELRGPTGSDTVNIIYNGLKQGKWIIRGKDKHGTSHHAEEKVEEGFYKDDKKVGYWKKYSPEGTILDSILFENGIEVRK